MGNSFSLAQPSAGSAGIDVPELADLVHERTIGSARFMKSVRARHNDGLVVAKVTVKPFAKMPLDMYRDKVLQERDRLRDVPNALGFERAFETETNGYLVRQYLYSSLYDRLSTRPFLEDIEKKWLAFQLLCALRDCHAHDVYHGDIKTENVMVTSWNWLYLTDFTGSFKPVKLPDDNPSIYSYCFDQSGRRTGYIAPERFVPPDEAKREGGMLTWSMDIFSAGCVIAEMFLESPILNLSQLFKYRRGEYDPVISHLSRIPDQGLREMLSSMIHLDPEKRYSAEQYLSFYKGKVFPEYFYSFLHQYMELLTDPTSGRAPVSGSSKNFGEADDRIDRVFYDFDKISFCLGHHDDKTPSTNPTRFTPRLGLGLFPVRLSIPSHEHFVSAISRPEADDGALIFLTLVASSLRSTARAASKIRACDTLLAFSERLSDEAKLDRVLPYLMALLNDEVDLVAISALRSVTQLLTLVSVVTPVNAHVFPEYIMPRMQGFLSGASRQLSATGKERREPSALVRATYASCLGSLATTAKRFLALTAVLRADGAITAADPEIELGSDADTAYDGLFDTAHSELIDIFESHAKGLVEDAAPSVRRAFLSSVPELCIFFGSPESDDIILTHLNTYLNDRDWMLKCAFFDTIVGISVFLGSTTLEEFSLPLMVQAVTDPEEHVVHAALHSLAELANLGLLSKSKTWELIDVVGRFTVHPNIWIREAAAEYLSNATKLLSPADIRCIVLPLVRPFLRPAIIPEFSELDLLDSLKKPLPRHVFDHALTWAQKADRGLFWKAVRQQKQSTFTIASTALSIRSSRESQPQTLHKVARNDEDEQWLARLRNMGMATEDEFKLLALREFIWKLSQMKVRDSMQSELQVIPLNSIMKLRDLKVQMQTVMFDETAEVGQSYWQQDRESVGEDGAYTIADAILDASMTIDEPMGRRRRAAINSHRSRFNSQHSGGLSRNRDNGALSPVNSGPPSPMGSRAPSVDSRRPSSTTRERPGSRDNDKSISDAPFSSRRAIRHQSSALDLLKRKDSRSIAETGTTETNAFGQVEGPWIQNTHQKLSIPESIAEDTQPGARLRGAHSYEGNDPSILKMLDSMYIDNYPHDISEFGPLVSPVSRRKTVKGSKPPTDDAWKPNGRPVATFSEHSGAINRVVPSPDHAFFLTGGNDGCVKVWDSTRLERNATHRSRHTHRHSPGARVVALCFIENTYTFVSCATDGRVHVVKVDTALSGNSLKYLRLRVLREYQLPADEYAVWSEHYKQDLNSVLILATNRSRILGIDLRTMQLLFVLENPVHHGTPTCFCVDRKRNWLLVGTSHGILDLWDLRFKMRLKGWGMAPGGSSTIHRLCLHPTKGRGKWVCVAGGTGVGGGEVTVWDLEKTVCREVYRVGKEGPKEYRAWDVDEGEESAGLFPHPPNNGSSSSNNKPPAEGSMLGRFATNIEPPSSSSSSSAGAAADRGIRAMVVGTGSLLLNGTDEQQQQQQQNNNKDMRYGYIVTGASDKKLRFWDLFRVENSTVFSGLRADEPKPIFASAAMSHQPGLTLNVERVGKRGEGTSSSAGGGGGGKEKAATAGKGGSGSGGGAGRHSVISAEQGQLLRSHLDSVLDVAVLEVPYSMTVSVDRSGVIFVFQ